MTFPLSAGRRRRFIVLGLVAATGLVAVLFAALAKGNSLWIAVAIFFVSLVGFHVTAFVSFECTTCWRLVDYPWVLATFMAIVIALTNLFEASRVAPLTAAQTERRLNYERLVYQMKTVITNDCHPKESRKDIWVPAKEPYEGACDRIEHFLPQIEDEALRDSLLTAESFGNAWGFDVLVSEENAQGSWAQLYKVAHQFEEVSKRTQAVVEQVTKTPRSPIAAWAAGENLRYWYYALAFFLALRLSKISAELLATHMARPPASVAAGADEASTAGKAAVPSSENQQAPNSSTDAESRGDVSAL